MKKLFFFLIALVSLSLSLETSALSESIDWSKLQVSSEYDTQTQDLTLKFSLDIAKAPRDYTLGIKFDAQSFRKPFVFNAKDTEITTSFVFDMSQLQAKYPYSISVKDAQYYEKFALDGTMLFGTGFTNPTKTQTPTTQTPSTKNIIQSGVQLVGNSVVNIPQNISISGNTGTSQTSTQTGSTTKPTISVVKPTSSNTGSTSVKKYIPKYQTPSQEPKVINGIGNSPSYQSWRIEE